MKIQLAEKSHMTQVFDADGNVHAVTVLRAPGVTVTDIRSKERDGYEAIQVAMDEQKESRASKAELGHFGGKAYKNVREFRIGAGDLQKGAVIKADIFQSGDIVMVSGLTKAKGFQGGVKRHGFKGGWDQHGQKHSAREVGSVGATWPQRILKGKRMGGRMGGDRVTVKNIKIYSVDTEKGEILVTGAVPGRRGTLIEIRTVKD
ncbi:MAG: large subunit ribosomal protein [Patescibacteria group bacterium]|nr:large subunit ribosomal protein [Patescibacteria group bacterium]